ncbi:MAG: hypothetical protein ACHQ0J_03150 [Candidatus Dormibacterales bacterium]
MRRSAVVALAAAVYLVAAWMVAPGFYDGFAPPAPYNWTCPPPQIGANNPPSSGHVDIKVIAGASDADSAFTDDGQIVVGFLPGAFDVTGKTGISVDITPLKTCPQPAGIRFDTNVYQITATAPLVKDSNLVMRYSNLTAVPSDIYFATDPAGPWSKLVVAQQSQPYTLDTTTRQFGYFGAGEPLSSASPGPTVVGGSQLLPIVVGVLVAIVVLAGLPVALLRRRRAAEGGSTDEDEEELDGDEDEV